MWSELDDKCIDWWIYFYGMPEDIWRGEFAEEKKACEADWYKKFNWHYDLEEEKLYTTCVDGWENESITEEQYRDRKVCEDKEE